ncbi:hypothetical protein ACHAPK_008761 [Fusarium culmorum]
MGQNLATLLAPEGITVNIVSHPMSRHDSELIIQVSPAMIGSTGMIPPPKSETWDKGCDLEGLKETDPGLAIATSVPIHRLGCPDEVCNVIIMMAKNGYLTGQDVLLSGGLK